MAQFSKWLEDKGGWPSNIWAGTSITSSASTARILPLLAVGDERCIRFASLEPQLEAIDDLENHLAPLDWVIHGGASGSKATARDFDVNWARLLISICSMPGMPRYFLKQLGRNPIENGRRLQLQDGHGGDWTEWPADVRVRQMPIAPSPPIGSTVESAGPTRCIDAAQEFDNSEVKRRRREAALKAWETRRRLRKK